MDPEVTIQAFWLVSALKDTKVYHVSKHAGLSGQAVLIETQSTASGSIRESLDWLSLSLEVPVASRVGFVSLVASFPSAKCNLILTLAHSGVIYMAHSMEIGQLVSNGFKKSWVKFLSHNLLWRLTWQSSKCTSSRSFQFLSGARKSFQITGTVQKFSIRAYASRSFSLFIANPLDPSSSQNSSL